MTNFTHIWITRLGGIFPVRCSWCGCRAEYVMTRVDDDDNKYVNNICHSHMLEWEQYREGVQLAMEI